MSMDEVWKNTVDGNTWECKVTSPDTNRYRGVLEVTNVATGEVVHREDVPIAYGAPFGPDVDDVANWSDRSIDVIDHPDHRSVVS